MKTFSEELLEAGFIVDNLPGSKYYSFKFGDGYELAIEPLLFDNQYHVALYKDGELLMEKIPIKSGKV